MNIYCNLLELFFFTNHHKMQIKQAEQNRYVHQLIHTVTVEYCFYLFCFSWRHLGPCLSNFMMYQFLQSYIIWSSDKYNVSLIDICYNLKICATKQLNQYYRISFFNPYFLTTNSVRLTFKSYVVENMLGVLLAHTVSQLLACYEQICWQDPILANRFFRSCFV